VVEIKSLPNPDSQGEPAFRLQINRLSLRSNRFEFKTAGELLIVLEESMGYIPI
jgi:hypothetical protein